MFSRLFSGNQAGIIALILLAWVFATMGIFARYLDTSFDLFEQTYLRIGCAFLLGILVFWRDIKWEKLKTLPGRDIAVLAFRGVSVYLGVVLFTEALLNTKYGNASFIAVLPLLPLFGYVFLKEKLALRTVGYILVGFFGVALIAVNDFSNLSFGYGEIMAFLSMIAFDFSYVARRWHSDHLSNKESAVFMFAIATVFLFACSYLLGEGLPSVSDFTPLIIATLIISALFNLANLVLTNYGFQHVKVGIAGNILTLETVFALAYSVLLFSEIPTARELLGGALVVASVILVNRSENG